jgi:thiol-disulfide isomerase/thioredoxin
MMPRLLQTLAILLLAGTLPAQTPAAWSFQTPEGAVLKPGLPARGEAHVYVFLSPECPLCENYSLTLNQLRKQFPERQVRFFGVFSGTYYSSETIAAYLSTYKPAVEPLLDPGYVIKSHFQAKVTPEVFVVDGTGGTVYSGKIDNWAIALGKKRQVVTEFYLRDALRAHLAGQAPAVRRTEPVGCFIQ